MLSGIWLQIRRILVGSPLPTWRAIHERLPKFLALPIFASDALSSVAYATEEILLVLVLAGPAILMSPMVVFIGLTIVVLLWLVATSYRQTIYAYPSGGGAYIVAKDNLGDKAGLAAGAALTIDYTLTVAVSIAAGVAAFISAYPQYAEHRVVLSLIGIAILTLGNLRGVRESGALFAAPTYVFILSMFALIAIGFYREMTGGLVAPSAAEMPQVPVVHTLGLFLLLRAFSGGCTAMTGTEAISNAVQAFKPPEARNAARTLLTMAAILTVMFAGVSFLAYHAQVVPISPYDTSRHYETVVSQIARATFGSSWFYYMIQWATTMILLLAANTSYAGFPRLASIMARDRFMPRQLYNVGDRLVFSNGILLLSLLAGLLIVLFHGDTHSLLPLYAVGVFLSFTLSQYGMAVRFRKLRQPGWQAKAALSTIGAVVTAIVTLVLSGTKFKEGAWIVVVLIPALGYAFWAVHKHYITIGNELRLRGNDDFVPMKNTVLVLTPSLHRGILPALEYAKSLSGDVRAIHIETDPVDTELMIDRWDRWGGGIPLVILESQYRSLLGPLIEYLEEVKIERENYRITVVIPEFVPAKWWHKLLHNQSGLILRIALLFRRDIITANVRYYLER